MDPDTDFSGITRNPTLEVQDDANCCDKTYSYLCHPTGRGHRFIALVLMCFLGFGAYFCYDNPAALQDHFKSDLNITDTQFTAMYSVYSWPNVVLCFVGGFLMDRIFGIRLGSNIFMGLTLIGQLLFTFAVYTNWFWLMIIGRFIFGIGAESLAVAQNNYAVLWFKGKELNMVFGLQMSIARIGSTVNFWVMEEIYSWVSGGVTGYAVLGITLLIATTTCVFSMLSSLVLSVIDKRAERITMRAETQSTEIVKLTDVKKFRLPFWIICLVCVTYYNAIFPFTSISQGFLMDRFHMTSEDADFVGSLIYLISGVASPITGLLIDKTGLNLCWILSAIVSTVIAHLLLGFSTFNPYIGVSLLGFAYSVLASSLWPMVALVIPEYQLGTAYGMCQSVQNLGLACVSICTGWIIQHYGYRVLSEFFIINLLLSFVAASALLLVDQHQRGILNLQPTERRQRQDQITNRASDILDSRRQVIEAENLIAAEMPISHTNAPEMG